MKNVKNGSRVDEHANPISNANSILNIIDYDHIQSDDQPSSDE